MRDGEKDEARLGRLVTGWNAPPWPKAVAVSGHYVRLEPLSATRHAVDLHQANAADDGMWDYMPYGPFASATSYYRWVREVEGRRDPMFFALRDLTGGQAGGVASYLRVAPEAGSIELGHIALSPTLQRTRAATEAMYLMMRGAFDAGYRRFEWKCNARNLASRCAAQRLGLSFEGVFRQAAVVKGRNRDTAWFAAIDREWPDLQAAFEAWLAPDNFDARGQQIMALGELTRDIRVASDPALT